MDRKKTKFMMNSNQINYAGPGEISIHSDSIKHQVSKHMGKVQSDVKVHQIIFAAVIVKFNPSMQRLLPAMLRPTTLPRITCVFNSPESRENKKI
jgi:hypothetical protein